MESNLHEGGDQAWKQIAPLLNDAIVRLDEKDRSAIALRYLEGQSLKEVGAALGASEDAAKKIVSRAVEKLRLFFGHRGVALSGAVLTGCIAANSVEAAPAGLAVAQGDPTALDKLAALAKAENRCFRSNSAASNDTERGDLARQTFAPLHAAFDPITEEASKGNQAALQAISRAILIPELQGPAITSAGILAGNGDEVALEILLNPTAYHAPPSSMIGALGPAADNGNQKAIDALAAVAAGQNQRALWYLAADGLGNAAASGNSAAIDALIAMSGETNQSVRRVMIAGLQRASANQNAKATDALRQMSNQ